MGVDYQVRLDETFLFGKMYLENFSTEAAMISQRVIVVIFGWTSYWSCAICRCKAHCWGVTTCLILSSFISIRRSKSSICVERIDFVGVRWQLHIVVGSNCPVCIGNRTFPSSSAAEQRAVVHIVVHHSLLLCTLLCASIGACCCCTSPLCRL